MEKQVITAEKRTVTGKQVGQLRRQGKLPGVIYGRHLEATPILMDLKATTRILDSLTASSLVNLNVDGTEHSVLVREKQRDYLKDTYLHVDFLAVSLTETLTAHVGVELVGESPAVKDFNCIIVREKDQLEVECLPQDLPQRITLDISTLVMVGDSLSVADVDLGDKVTILDNPADKIVIATAARIEEEPVVEEEAIEGEGEVEAEVIEKGKKEEEGEEEEAAEEEKK
ncbi:MAG: 50S ribosomal protein L25 [Anaerolineaceae bacterium]|nr:50S ribosomal protein L25 [Anaerolineaceae bacterium]